MKTRIPSAAYHEAGHAVVAFVVGMHVDLVSVETQGFPPGWLLRGEPWSMRCVFGTARVEIQALGS